MTRILRYALLTLAVALTILFARGTWDNLKPIPGFDFYIYYVNAQIAGRPDVPNIYSPEVQQRIGEEFYVRAQYTGSDRQLHDATMRRRLDSVSSPFLYTTLGWLSPIYERSLRHYRLLLMVSFVLGVLLLCLAAKLPLVGSFFLLAFLVGWYFPFHGDLIVGNVNSLQLVALGLTLVVGRRSPLAAGFLLGLLLSFKPNLVLIPLLLAVSRVMTGELRRLRVEVIGGAIGGLTAFAAAAIHYHDPRVWFYWLTAAGQFWERFPPRADRNIAPALSLFQQHGAWPSYLIAALLTGAVIWGIYRSRRSDDLLVVSLGILVYLMSATVVWVHYLVLLVPLAVALMRRKETVVVAIAALILVGGNVLEVVLRRSVIPFEATLIFWSITGCFLAGVWMLARREDEWWPFRRRGAGRVDAQVSGGGMVE